MRRHVDRCDNWTCLSGRLQFAGLRGHGDQFSGALALSLIDYFF